MRNHICVHCGCLLSPGEEYIFHEDFYCEDCLEELTTFCVYCGKRIFKDNDEGDNNISLCHRCFTDHYVACERCGRLVLNEDAYYESDDEDIPYCRDCFQDISFIHSYNYKPDPIFYGDASRYFGIELEVDLGGELNKNAKRVTAIANEKDWHVYCKRDGSLDDGFEVVTHPMTLDYHCNQMPWKKVLIALREMGYRSHQTTTAGLHVHINRSSLGDTYDEQEETVARLLYLVEKYWEELVKFSRRPLSQLDRWAARYGFKNCPKEILKTAKGGYGRYTCINLCNDHTIEFRIFRGTLKYNTIIATLQLVEQLCNVAYCFSDEQIQSLSWTTFVSGCTKPELVQYLKERRLYVNEPVESEVEV